MRRLCSPTVAIFVLLPLAGTAAPQKAFEKVCEFEAVAAGQMDGRTFKSDGPTTDRARPIRLTFRDQDPEAGAATMLVEGLDGEREVTMTVEEGAIVYLHGDTLGKLLISTETKPGPDAWPAVATQHGWEGGRLTLKALAGFCLMRKR